MHTYIHTYIHTYVHTCIHTYVHTYIHTHICTYIHKYIHTYVHTYSIGYAIADRLAGDGAKVMVSSRKQNNVEKAVDSLRCQHGNEAVYGTVCHVGKSEDRKRIMEEVKFN